MAKQKLLLDTNIVVDYIARREPFYEQARLLMLLGRIGEASLWISSSQVTDLVYVLASGGRRNQVHEVLEQLSTLRMFVNVYAVADADIDKMLATTWPDPEDALLVDLALKMRADAIIARDADFVDTDAIHVFDCEGFFNWLEETHGISYADVPF